MATKDRTYSRYDFMTEGTQTDPISGSNYPDPLSLVYVSFKTPSSYKKDIMTDTKISSFWHEAEKAYGKAAYDDIVLTLNGVSHKNLLEEGDVIYFPAVADIESSFSKSK